MWCQFITRLKHPFIHVYHLSCVGTWDTRCGIHRNSGHFENTTCLCIVGEHQSTTHRLTQARFEPLTLEGKMMTIKPPCHSWIHSKILKWLYYLGAPKSYLYLRQKWVKIKRHCGSHWCHNVMHRDWSIACLLRWALFWSLIALSLLRVLAILKYNYRINIVSVSFCLRCKCHEVRWLISIWLKYDTNQEQGIF